METELLALTWYFSYLNLTPRPLLQMSSTAVVIMFEFFRGCFTPWLLKNEYGGLNMSILEI